MKDPMKAYKVISCVDESQKFMDELCYSMDLLQRRLREDELNMDQEEQILEQILGITKTIQEECSMINKIVQERLDDKHGEK